MRDAPLTYTSFPGSKDGTVVLKLAGPLTLTSMFPLQNELRTLTPPVLLMDVSEVPYMDSAGLGLLPNYHVSAERDGRKFLLVGVNSRVAALLGHTKIDTFLKIFPTVEAAEASL